jgi:hypothetical protein
VRALLVLAGALVLAGTGCATAPRAPNWPVYGTKYAFEVDRGPVYHVTFRDPEVLEWSRLQGVEAVGSGTQPYRLVKLRSGVVLVTWRDRNGVTVTFVTDTFSWEVTATISRAGDPILMHGRVRPASRTGMGANAGEGGSP